MLMLPTVNIIIVEQPLGCIPKESVENSCLEALHPTNDEILICPTYRFEREVRKLFKKTLSKSLTNPLPSLQVEISSSPTFWGGIYNYLSFREGSSLTPQRIVPPKQGSTWQAWKLHGPIPVSFTGSNLHVEAHGSPCQLVEVEVWMCDVSIQCLSRCLCVSLGLFPLMHIHSCHEEKKSTKLFCHGQIVSQAPPCDE